MVVCKEVRSRYLEASINLDLDELLFLHVEGIDANKLDLRRAVFQDLKLVFDRVGVCVHLIVKDECVERASLKEYDTFDGVGSDYRPNVLVKVAGLRDPLCIAIGHDALRD